MWRVGSAEEESWTVVAVCRLAPKGCHVGSLKNRDPFMSRRRWTSCSGSCFAYGRSQPHASTGRGEAPLVVVLDQIPADDHHVAAQAEHLLEYLVDTHAVVLLVASR